MIDLIPLDEERLRALAADPAAALAGLGCNAGAVAEIVGSVARATLHHQGRTGARAPWIGYLARCGGGAVIGTCAFMGPPSDGAVEIAYFTFPGHERRGHGSAMAGALVGIALADPAVREVIAHTLPEENASTRLLRRHGFRLRGAVSADEHGEVWRWSLGRAEGRP